MARTYSFSSLLCWGFLSCAVSAVPGGARGQAAAPGVGKPEPTAGASVEKKGLVESGTPNGQFFSQNEALIYRLNGRLFVGGAVSNDGAFPNVSRDWLAQLQAGWGHDVGYSVPSMVNVLTTTDPASSYGLLGAAQTLYARNRGAAAIGVQGHAIANNSMFPTNAWAFYGEAHRTVQQTGSAYAMELDAVGHVENISPNPSQQGNLVGLQLACGGEYRYVLHHDCSAAIQIAPNGARFKTGINFMAGALPPGNPAILLPSGNGIGFYGADTKVDHAIDTAGQVLAAGLGYSDGGLWISGSDGTTVALFDSAPENTAFLRLSGASAGQPAALRVAGKDASAGLVISAEAGAPVAISNLQLQPTRFAALPKCDSTTLGSIAFILDAREPVKAWHQRIAAGGGSNPAFISCNGLAWHAFSF